MSPSSGNHANGNPKEGAMSSVPAQSRGNGENEGPEVRPELTVVNDIRSDSTAPADNPTNTECVPPTVGRTDTSPEQDTTDNGDIRIPIDVIEDDEETAPTDDLTPEDDEELVSINTKKPGFLVRWYITYFYALLRYVVESDGVRDRMVRKYFEGHLFTNSDTLGGVVSRDRSLCITIGKAEQVIDECIHSLRRAFYNDGDFNYVVYAYVNLELVNTLTIDMPGRPSVGPWWTFLVKPTLRRSAFSWLDRHFQVHLNNAGRI